MDDIDNNTEGSDRNGLNGSSETSSQPTGRSWLGIILDRREDFAVVGLSIILMLTLLVLAISYIWGLANFDSISKYHAEDWHVLLNFLWIIVGVTVICIFLLLKREGLASILALLVIATLVADKEWILDSIAVVQGTGLDTVRQSRAAVENNNYDENIAELSEEILQAFSGTKALNDKIEDRVLRSVVEKVLSQSEDRRNRQLVEREGLTELFMSLAGRAETSYQYYLDQHRGDPRFIEDMRYLRDLGLLSFSRVSIENASLTLNGRRLMVLIDQDARLPDHVPILRFNDGDEVMSYSGNMPKSSNYSGWVAIDLSQTDGDQSFVLSTSSQYADVALTLYKVSDKLRNQIESIDEDMPTLNIPFQGGDLEFVRNADDNAGNLQAELTFTPLPEVYLAHIENLEAESDEYRLNIVTDSVNTQLTNLERSVDIVLDDENQFRHRFSINIKPGIHTINAIGDIDVDTYLELYEDENYQYLIGSNDDDLGTVDARLVLENCYADKKQTYYLVVGDINSVPDAELELVLESDTNDEIGWGVQECIENYELKVSNYEYEYDDESEEYYSSLSVQIEESELLLDVEQSLTETDVLKFGVENNSIYGLELGGIDAEGGAWIEILDSDEYVVFDTQIAGGNQTNTFLLDEGQYSLRLDLYDLDADERAGVKLEIKLTESPVIKEWLLAESHQVELEIQTGFQYEIVLLSVPESGMYQINTLSTGDSIDPVMAVFDKNFQTIGQNDDNDQGDVDAAVNIQLKEGAYYIFVADMNESGGPISVQATLDTSTP